MARKPPVRPSVTSVTSPKNGTIITCGDSVKISLSPAAAGNKVDSVVITDGKNPGFRLTGKTRRLLAFRKKQGGTGYPENTGLLQ